MKCKVSDVAVINSQNFNFRGVDYVSYLDTGSITNNYIDSYQKLQIGVDSIPSRAKRSVRKNTIVYSCVRPRLCHYGILKNIPQNVVVSTGFITIDAIESKIDPDYLYCLLTTKDRTEYLAKIADTAASSYPAISPDDLADLEIDIVEDLKEQKKIANILMELEAKIANNNAINAELEAMAKTIYDYWFLQFEFPDENGKPYKSSGGKMVYNEELKREIPEGWEVKSLLDLCAWEGTSQPPKSVFVYSPQKGYVRFIQNRDYEDNTHATYIPIAEAKGLCEEKDILIDKYGDAGKTRFGLAGAYNVALSRINVHNIIHREYVRAFLSSMPVYTYLHESSMASTRASLNENNISYLRITIPPVEILSKYNLIAENIIDKTLHIKKENQELASLRDFLLPLLMNGQVGFKEEV